MTKLVLANRDYQQHMTDEGEQLQRGLQHAGWTLAGAGYGDGLRDVRALIDRYQPEVVFVQDKRDFDPASPGSFRKDVGFQRLGCLADRPDVFKVAVVKDAGTVVEYQLQACREIGANAVLVYYHPTSVLAESGWLRDYPLIRTWHTVDGDSCRSIAESLGSRHYRERAVVSGAVNSAVYPLRGMAVSRASFLRVDVLRHPGYNNRGARTPDYLRKIAGYKVHIATSSRYRFALRKIIESVAVGAVPITDLPDYDVLPEIDGALVRVSPDISPRQLRDLIDEAEANWNLEERLHYARRAWRFYDYRIMGLRNSEAISNARAAVTVQ